MALSLEFDSKYQSSVDIVNFENVGLDKIIFLIMDKLLSPPLKDAADKAEGDAKVPAQKALTEARLGWEKLSYAIAKGVMEHIMANMEIYGIQTSGNIKTDVDGATKMALSNYTALKHSHDVDLEGVKDNAIFTQSNDGTGHVR